MIDSMNLQDINYLRKHYKELIGYKFKLIIIDAKLLDCYREFAIVKEFVITSIDIDYRSPFCKIYLDDGNYISITRIHISYESSVRRYNCYFIKE